MSTPIFATVTLGTIRAKSPCFRGVEAFTAKFGHLGLDTPVPLLACLDSNPVHDVIWALRAVQQPLGEILPLIAADLAEDVLPLFPETLLAPALDTLRAFMAGEKSEEELRLARSALRDLQYDRLPDNEVHEAVVRSVAFALEGAFNPNGNPFSVNLTASYALAAALGAALARPEVKAAIIQDPENEKELMQEFAKAAQKEAQARQVEILKRYFSLNPA